MNRKVVILIIVTFLAMLFLSTVGGIFTGFVIYKGSETDLKSYPYPFIKNGYNNLLIVTPTNPTAEEAQAANKIAQSLKTYAKQPLLPKIVTDKWFTARYSIESYNLILIGKKFNNKLIPKVLAKNPGILLADNSNDGNIIIFNNKGRLVKSATIIVSGNVEKAANVLTNFKNNPLKGTNIIISGEKGFYNLNYK